MAWKHGCLGVFSAVAFVIINLIPAFARLVGNWRLKALKAVAAANPIENLEMIYRDKMNALAASRENINATYAILQAPTNFVARNFSNASPAVRRWRIWRLESLS